MEHFLVVEEPEYSKKKLLEYQRKYGVSTLELFEYLNNFGVTPVKISERELALWEHYFEIFRIAGGNLSELN